MTIYVPKPAPIVNDPELAQVVRWLEDEIRNISYFLKSPEFEIVRFTTLNSEPAKPQNGDHVRADGTNWNPGSGEGEYERKTGAWSKL